MAKWPTVRDCDFFIEKLQVKLGMLSAQYKDVSDPDHPFQLELAELRKDIRRWQNIKEQLLSQSLQQPA